MAREVEKKKDNKKVTKKNSSKKKDSVKKVVIDKKEEIKKEIDEVLVEEVVTEPVVEETIVMAAIDEENKDTKVEKKKRFWEEVKSFFILIIIIGLVVLGGWLFSKYAKPFDSKNDNRINSSDTDVETDISYVSYKKEYDKLTVIGNKYLIDSNDDNIKIMDLDLNILTELEDETDYQFFIGIDGNLYAVEYFDLDTSVNALFLYVLENDKLVQVKEFVDDNTVYNLILNNAKLFGIYEQKKVNDKDGIIWEKAIYKLNGDRLELGNYWLESGSALIDAYDDYDVVNNNYVVVSKSDDGKSLFGIYDLNIGKLIVEVSYDAIYATEKDAFIVEKDGKTGIINSKRKLLVDYEYDFIADNGDFYVVSKNNKLAIMNSDYELITDFDFDLQSYDKDFEPTYYYQLCCAHVNGFDAYMFEDKYVLSINGSERYFTDTDYEKHETYIINEDGTYLTIEANYFDINGKYATASLSESRELVVYETEEFKEVYRLDFSDYDYDELIYSEMFGDSLIVSFDSDIYYSLEDGKEKDANITYVKGDVTFKYNYDEEIVTMGIDGKKYDFDIYNLDISEVYPVDLENGDFYFITSDEFVKINKR